MKGRGVEDPSKDGKTKLEESLQALGPNGSRNRRRKLREEHTFSSYTE
jgi:hypothetical protein